MMLTKIKRLLLPRLSPSLVGALLLGCLAGCHDPIYDSVTFQPPANEIALASKADHDQYEWPLTRDGYVVAKPPQMAYVTSFAKPLHRPDPVDAKLVSWSDEGLDDRAKRFLHEAYSPVQEKPDKVLSLAKDQFKGLNAFDVSVDGSRLVVLDDRGLALYKTDDGSRIGHMMFPAKVASAQPPVDAVRFCGVNKDLLVASTEMIYRISAKDGSVTASSKGCGEPMMQWIVNDDDQSMIIRSESGKIFGGDPKLEYFSAYNVGKDQTFNAVSLSPDGSRIGVCVDGIPRTYLQENFQIVDHVDYTNVRLNRRASISSGVLVDAWVDGSNIFYTIANDKGTRSTGKYPMLWKPLFVSQATDNDSSNWFLTLGMRFIDGKEQFVIFDHGASSRNHSLPTVLDQWPVQIAHSRDARRVAVMDDRGLHVYHRQHWRSARPIFLDHWTYQWINEDKIPVIKRVLEIVESQDRLGYGSTSEELRTIVLSAIGDRWRYLTENDPDGEILARLEAWRNEEDPLALVASGCRHYKLAWRARGGGYVDSVTQDGWKLYEKHLQLAKAELDKAIAMGNPPLIAFEYRIQAGLETQEDLTQVDPLCRQATELYPGEIEPHDSIIFKLLPQWFGERGDALSFALSVSKMLEGREGDLQYLRFVSRMTNRVSLQDQTGWKSYDSNRVQRGLDEYFRREVVAGNELWYLWMQLQSRTRNNVMADRVLKHLMAHRAAAPRGPGSYTDDYADAAHQSAVRIRTQ